MWFKQLSDHSSLVDPVAGVRSLLQKHFKDRGRSLSTPVYSKLHYGYVMTLNEVGVKAKFPDEPRNLRVLESDANGSIAFHEVSLNKEKPKLLQSFLGAKYISNFHEGIEKIRSREKDETKGEIRHLSVPALNVEAIWLHFDEGKHDRFALTRDFNVKDSRTVYNGHDFLALLAKLKNKLGKIDDEMGA